MTKYVLRRLAATVPVFFGATFVVWAMVFALPGDPIRALSGFRAQPPEVNLALREQYNLNDPLLVQYPKYLWNVLSFDFGSGFTGADVSDQLRVAFPHTLRVLAVAVVFAVVLGVIAGTVAAVNHRRITDGSASRLIASCLRVGCFSWSGQGSFSPGVVRCCAVLHPVACCSRHGLGTPRLRRSLQVHAGFVGEILDRL